MTAVGDALFRYWGRQMADRNGYAWAAMSTPGARSAGEALARAADANARDARADLREFNARFRPGWATLGV